VATYPNYLNMAELCDNVFEIEITFMNKIERDIQWGALKWDI
jgi:hypothetical protein